MIFESKFKTGLRDIGKDNLIKNETILEILEDVGGEHSNLVGYGALEIEKTRKSWILLDWRVKIIKRPVYSEELKVKTWGRYFQKAYTYRDFEIYNSKGELAVIATSKWAMVDIDKGGIVRLTEEIRDCYKPEEKSVFEEETLDKPIIPNEFSNVISYKIGRKDIDLNNHMHNTYYLNLAYEALPEKVYEDRPYDEIRIMYKHEMKLGDIVECKYANLDNKHIVTIMNKGCLSAVVELAKA